MGDTYYEFELVRSRGGKPLLIGLDQLDRAVRLRLFVNGRVTLTGRTGKAVAIGELPSTVMILGVRVAPGISQEEVRNQVQRVMSDLGRPDIKVSNADVLRGD